MWFVVNSVSSVSHQILQLCEIDLSDILPPEALSPFIDEIKKREKQRKRVAKKVLVSVCVLEFDSTPLPRAVSTPVFFVLIVDDCSFQIKNNSRLSGLC